MIHLVRPRPLLYAPIALACAAAVTLSGCSSSGAKAHSSTPKASTPAAPSGSGSSADAATTAAVKAAYGTFFNTKTSLAQSQATLQHGTSFTATLNEQSKNAAAQALAATVSAVTLTSPNVAVVTFTLTSKGAPLLPNTHGKAVREGGSWKVAAETFCALLSLQGTPPSACKDPKITGLPN